MWIRIEHEPFVNEYFVDDIFRFFFYYYLQDYLQKWSRDVGILNVIIINMCFVKTMVYWINDTI